jgi:phosphoribosyl-AMP cyclohydrolase
MTEHPTQGPDFNRGNNGLLPAIAQDASSGQVLMLAYMNQQSYDETLASGQATYWSRSRQSLWKKGETSGHWQTVEEVFIDCDADTILLKVQQQGPACHEGYQSCFYRQVTDEGLRVIDHG